MALYHALGMKPWEENPLDVPEKAPPPAWWRTDTHSLALWEKGSGTAACAYEGAVMTEEHEDLLQNVRASLTIAATNASNSTHGSC
jgi:hypothetical protein